MTCSFLLLYYYYYYYFFSLQVFHTTFSSVFCLSDSKSPLSVLAYFNNAVVWVVLILCLISIFLPVTSPGLWGQCQAHKLQFGVIVTLMFHNFFFSSVARLKYGQLEWQNLLVDKFFVFCWFWGLADPFVSQRFRKFCVCHLLGEILVCTYSIC